MVRLRAGLLLAVLLVVAGPAAAESWKLVNDHSFYPESPLRFGGRLLYVEYAAHTVMAWDGHENRQVWKQEGCGPSGLAPWRDGLLVTCYDSNSLVLIGTVAGQPFLGPNDFAEDGKGGVYVAMSGGYDVTAPIQGKVYHLDAAGTLTKVADDIHYSNGMALTNGGKTLLVAEMLAQRVLRFDVNPDGTLGQRWVFLRLRDLVPEPQGADAYYGPDGLKVGKDGDLYIAENGGGEVLVTDPSGKKLLRRLPVGSKYVTNVGLGPDEDVAYVSAADDPWNAPFPGKVYEVLNR